MSNSILFVKKNSKIIIFPKKCIFLSKFQILMKNKWFQNTSYNIPTKYHIVFWLGYFSFNVVRWGSYFNDYWYSLKSNFVEFPLHILIVYLNIYFLIPQFILKKKYLYYVLLFLFSLFILYTFRTGLNYILVTKDIWPEAETPQQAFTFNHIVAVILGELYVVALATAIKLIVDWIYERKRVQNLQQIQLETELKFLKSQIKPHFFFNTLNNLYSLTLDKSEIAPSVVLKLSEIMRYVIYDVKEKKVKLLNEINYIQNYLDLEKLRHRDSLKTNVDIIGNIEDIKVPPLLFISFIENCFKHGVKNQGNLIVNIVFENYQNKWLIFNAENSYEIDKVYENSKLESGIGLENTKRRLQLLYNNEYELTTKIIDNKYCVQLKIPIK